MKVEIAKTRNELKEAAEVMLQLRPQFSRADLVAQMCRQQQECGWQLACVKREGGVIAVAGFVVRENLAWGRHIYVDDLVTDEDSRGQGAGTVLIDWLMALGAELGCRELHLDSGVQRFAAHRFYLRHGFDITSHHFARSGLGDETSHAQHGGRGGSRPHESDGK